MYVIYLNPLGYQGYWYRYEGGTKVSHDSFDLEA